MKKHLSYSRSSREFHQLQITGIENNGQNIKNEYVRTTASTYAWFSSPRCIIIQVIIVITKFLVIFSEYGLFVSYLGVLSTRSKLPIQLWYDRYVVSRSSFNKIMKGVSTKIKTSVDHFLPKTKTMLFHIKMSSVFKNCYAIHVVHMHEAQF